MDITKSQSDFEAWFKRDFHPDKSGPYLKDMLKKAFEAGRETLEVEIPDSGNYDYITQFAGDVCEVLRTAGIRIKGESE
ncbi:hypothetical protein B4900_10920 [Yersinia rohdei]|nr:hypothetical protein B4900_10920 [Yersinia rohdei]